MKWIRLHSSLAAVLMLGACAGTPDHFYTLNTLPDAPPTAPAPPRLHVHLNVTVPSSVDRSEMVVATSGNGIAILEHERWAAPLSDQISQTLARDLERRRADILVADGRFDQPGSGVVALKVDIVRISARRNAAAVIEAHWRVVDASAGVDRLGGDSFTAPTGGGDSAAVAQAYSRLLSELAARLAADVPLR